MDLYRARWLLPIEREPIENGAILVNGDRIAAIGRDPQPRADTIHDLGDCILLPGFVNAHTHLELSCYQCRLSPAPLWEWLEQLVTLRRQPDADQAERAAVLDGAAQSLAAGVTCVGDISRTGLNADILRASPIRKVCFLELFSGASQPPSDAASLSRVFEHAAMHAEPDRLIVGLSPHAPYSVGWSDLAGAIELADTYRLPLTMHLLETRDEQQWLESGGGPLAAFLARFGLPNAQSDQPRSARDILSRSGLLDRAPLLAHVNHADDDLLNLLAGTRASVVWCPRTHAFFGHSPHRWRDMLSLGINVCLGTDSLASAPSLSILDEVRFLRRLEPNTRPDLLLEMATRRAALGLHLSDRLGTLTRGKYADFIAIPWDSTAPIDPFHNILDGKSPVVSTWINGRRVECA